RGLALAASVRAAAAAYATADAVVGSAVVDFGRGLLELPRAVAVAVGGLVTTGDPGRSVQIALGDSPDLVDAVVLAAGGGSPAGVAFGLAQLFPDGHAVLTRPATPGEPVGADPAGPPRDVTDLIGALARRNRDVPGAIDVRILTTVDPDGTVHRRAVVDIPGTKDWSLDRVNPDVTNLGSNLRALSGAASTYADGVLAALAAAGVEPGTEVLFVGHSLGGMVALAAAGRAGASGYRVGGVVTAGSPLGAIAPPPGVPVLALENARDLVPHLDGAANPAGPDVTTVTVDHPHAATGDNHGLEPAYLPGAADVDASTDPSVVAARARLAPFLSADTVQTHVFVVSRSHP
ncbi:alpha/beta fold hydrolase, partial [Jatrophihabitans sp. YIM 134969]